MELVGLAGGGHLAGAWAGLALFGAGAGAAGQGLRLMAGLGKADAVPCHWRRAARGLGLGALAGAVAAVTALEPGQPFGTDALAAMLGAGYAGADFLEAVARHRLRLPLPPR